MKTIHTLVPDIYALLKTDGWFTEELAKEFSDDVALRLRGQLNEVQKRKTLRLSQMGPRCPKALWASIHAPDEAESLPPWARIKYSYGHIIEALAIALAKASGHEVTGEQDELILDGIKGHRDCVVDGCTLDVKSTSSRGFEGFKTGSIGHSDHFGYLDQLDGYTVAAANDPLVRVKDKAYILAIDKTLGHMALYEHHIREQSIRERIASYKGLVESSIQVPTCNCETVPDGKSGNIRLGTKASYSPYKYFCFHELRTFLYAGGPVYLTRVVRKPDVTEIDRYGKIVYN